jgi:DNA-binding transcriptional LysR family regulator
LEDAEAVLSSGTAQPRGRLRVDVPSPLARLIANLGVLWLPRYMVDAHATRGELVELFAAWRFDAMPLYVVYPPNRHVSAKVRAFVDWVVDLTAAMSTPAPT